MGYLYQLIPNAFTILSDSYAKIGEIGYEAATITNSPKQPVLENQLIHCSSLFYLLDSLIILNDDGDAIIGINADADLINALLLQLRDACGLNTLSQFPTPLTTLDFNTVNGSTYPVGGLGALLQSNGATYLPLEMGASGTVLTASPTGLVWSAVVGNGIPSGGTTGQYLEKIDNTSFNVQWATLTVGKITDLTATAAEINILDGVVGVTAAEISYLANVSSDIQTQFTGKLGTALNDGLIYIGNASNVATAVTPSGVIGLTNTGVFSIVNDSIVDADINSAASIARSKLAAGTANRIVINSSIGVLTDAAVINPNVVLISDANGIPTHSSVASATLGYLDISSSLQASLDARLVVSLTGVAQGDVLVYNGTNWINLALGTNGQVLQSNGTTVVWGSAAANGLPVGGTANQILRKIDGTDYNTEWHTFVMADVSDVSTTFTELNLLSGLTVNATLLNYLTGASSNIQSQINAKLDNNLSFHSIYVGGSGNTAQQVSAGTDGSVLTIVSGHPTWQTPPTPGNVSGPVSSTDNAIVRWNLTAGNSIQDSGIILDDSNNITFPTGAAIQTGTTSTNTLLFRAYDNDTGPGYITFATLTAGNIPTFDLSDSTTKAGQYIYRAGGTDIAVADGGTNLSSYTAGDLLYATGATTLAQLPIGTNGFILTVVAGAPAWQAVGSGAGTVTDFSAGTLSPLFTTSVATSTTTPALTFALSNAAANTYFGNATGSPAAPSYTAAGALTRTNDTNVTLTLGGTPTTSLLTATSLTLGWTGTLAIARGGTGLGSLGTANQLIRVNAGATALEYFTPTFISGNQTITLSGDVSGSGTTAITTAIGANKVLDTMIRQSAGLSVVGRSANTTGNVADITAASDFNILRRSGTSIGFGSINLASSGAVGTSILPVANGGTGSATQVWWGTTGSTSLSGDVEIETGTGTVSIGAVSNQTFFGVGGWNGTGALITSIAVGSTFSSSDYVELSFDLADIQGSGSGVFFNDLRITKKGIEYLAAGYVTTDRSLTDRGYVLGAKTFTGSQTFRAGTATAGTAPLYLQTGTALTTPADGALEYHTSHLYFTIGSTRYQLDQQIGTIPDAVADGVTKGIATFVSADFTSSAGVIGIDYTNATAASGSTKGFLTSADWTTFNNKVSGSSIASGQVAYGSGTNAITSTTAFLFNSGSSSIQLIDADYNLYVGPGLIINQFVTTTNNPFEISASPGIASQNNGQDLILAAGGGYTSSGDGSGASVLIQSGQRRVAGAGVDGNITLNSLDGFLIISTIPTSSAGLPSGAIWSNSGVLSIV